MRIYYMHHKHIKYCQKEKHVKQTALLWVMGIV